MVLPSSAFSSSRGTLMTPPLWPGLSSAWCAPSMSASCPMTSTMGFSCAWNSWAVGKVRVLDSTYLGEGGICSCRWGKQMETAGRALFGRTKKTWRMRCCCFFPHGSYNK